MKVPTAMLVPSADNETDAPKPKANIKGRTFEFDTMKKDLMKGLGMLFGYPDKQLPS